MFSELEDTNKHLEYFPSSYWVAGGWAVDLHIGRKTRGHKDVEIAIARHDQHLLLQLPDLQRIEYIEIGVAKVWDGTPLELPIHEMYCHFKSGFVLEVLLNEFNDTEWLYRRNKDIRIPLSKFLKDRGAPLPLEVVLLYKSKSSRDIDQQDFVTALPFLETSRKEWLRDALKMADQNHPWLERF